MDTLYESVHLIENRFFGWKVSAGPQSDPCRVTKASHMLIIRHMLKYFLHDKHLSLGLK